MKQGKKRACGFVLTGKLKEHLAHYRQCSHPECQGRLQAAKKMGQMMAKDLKEQQASKGAE